MYSKLLPRNLILIDNKSTAITKKEYENTINEFHKKIAETEENGKFKCCDYCYAKAKYTFDDDYIDNPSYRCGNHCKSLNDKIRRVKI